MDSTPVFNHTRHRILWQWLADNPRADKNDAFQALGFPPVLRNMCYACEACEALMWQLGAPTAELDCKFCPLEWPGGECEFDNANGAGLYSRWTSPDAEEDAELRADLARHIRDLPVKPDWPGKII